MQGAGETWVVCRVVVEAAFEPAKAAIAIGAKVHARGLHADSIVSVWSTRQIQHLARRGTEFQPATIDDGHIAPGDGERRAIRRRVGIDRHAACGADQELVGAGGLERQQV